MRANLALLSASYYEVSMKLNSLGFHPAQVIIINFSHVVTAVVVVERWDAMVELFLSSSLSFHQMKTLHGNMCVAKARVKSTRTNC